MTHRTTVRSVLSLALLAAAAACTPGCAHTSHEVSPSVIRERTLQIVQEDARWSSVAATRNPVAVAAFYSDDAIVYPPNTPMVVGRADAEKAWAGVFALPGVSISWANRYSGMSSAGDLGHTSGTYTLSFDSPTGQRIEDHGKFLCIWKRQPDGSWKSIHDMWNSDLPLPH